MLDLILAGGTIIDGTGGKRVSGDVGIAGDRIVGVGDLSGEQAGERIDVGGRVVAPGFIDVHNHSDGWLLKRPHLEPKTTQGFTTEVLMADGISYAPVRSETVRQWFFYLRGLNALRMDEYAGWESVGEYLEHIEGRCDQNFTGHVPYANVRSLACGFGKQAVDDLQMRLIQGEIRRGMQDGAVGLSTGLDYIVQCYSTTDELAEACQAVAEFDGLYVTHVRYKKGLLAGIREAVEIGRRAGVKVHISHVKGRDESLVEELLEYFDREARQQVDFSFDCYPYQPGSTMLNYLLPYEAWADGPLAAIDRLHDPTVRARFRAGLEAYPLDLDRIRIAWLPGRENSPHIGTTLANYVASTGRPFEEALYDLLIEERLAVLLVFDEGNDQLIEPLLQHDLCVIGSDGIFFPDGVVHPRVYGTAPRILGPLVRDRELFSLEEAVAKLSGRPAERFGLVDRGVIREGAAADLVVFDPDTITDLATYDDPHQPSDGVETVIVNGRPIRRDGEAVDPDSDDRPGRFLRYRRT